ncbi:TonB-dependent receptor, partial [Flavihumibacter sediminis]|nr:TonB-dependent receptor [Flavihumibacter sediminis]
NQLGIRTPDIDSGSLKNAFGLTNYNIYTNLAWKERLGKKWKLFLGTSYSLNRDDIENRLQDQDNKDQFIPVQPYVSKSFDVDASGSLLQVKTV